MPSRELLARDIPAYIEELERERDEALAIHAAEVERRANEYLPPHEARRKALVTLLDGLGYGAAAAVVRAGVTGGYFQIGTNYNFSDDLDMLADAIRSAPTVILVADP